MSWSKNNEPTCTASASDAVELLIRGKTRDIGGLMVRRVLPSQGRRMVGPVIFFDHVGPGDLPPGEGIDVRPHPHIGIATVTYLFEGQLSHRDSLGIHQSIEPGAVNWMTAGRGIVHSERSGPEFRKTGGRLHGIQLWIALPTDKEEAKPSFQHYPADVFKDTRVGPIRVRVLAGEAYGVKSPVYSLSPLLYAEAHLPKESLLHLPNDLPERAVYVVSGSVRCGKRGGGLSGPGEMLVFGEGEKVDIRSPHGAHVMLIAGEPVGHRYIEWNLVSSSRERIEKAKDDWRERRFLFVPGDEEERIPLPE